MSTRHSQSLLLTYNFRVSNLNLHNTENPRHWCYVLLLIIFGLCVIQTYILLMLKNALILLTNVSFTQSSDKETALKIKCKQLLFPTELLQLPDIYCYHLKKTQLFLLFFLDCTKVFNWLPHYLFSCLFYPLYKSPINSWVKVPMWKISCIFRRNNCIFLNLTIRGSQGPVPGTYIHLVTSLLITRLESVVQYVLFH